MFTTQGYDRFRYLRGGFQSIMSSQKLAVVALSLAMLFTIEGCKKKVTPPAPVAPPKAEAPAPPPAKKPSIVRFTAEPSTVEKGSASTLRWSVEDATSVTINPILGDVPLNGTRQVYPSSDVEYLLTATGPGGSTTASVRVNVTQPPPPPPPPAAVSKRTLSERLASDISDVFFAYDSYEIDSVSQSTLEKNAAALKAILADYPSGTIVLEGHCDERGSAEYNIGLGDKRATAAKDFISKLGVDASRFKVVSYGKEKPQCSEANEACWSKNRRAHFAAGE